MRAQCSIALMLCESLAAVHAAEPAAPLTIGETFTLWSKALGETRRINVYLPPGYAESADQRFAVLYTPDGGLAEDFLLGGVPQVPARGADARRQGALSHDG